MHIAHATRDYLHTRRTIRLHMRSLLARPADHQRHIPPSLYPPSPLPLPSPPVISVTNTWRVLPSGAELERIVDICFTGKEPIHLEFLYARSPDGPPAVPATASALQAPATADAVILTVAEEDAPAEGAWRLKA